MLQVVASLMIVIQTTCTVLELQIMLLENKYSRVVTHDNRYEDQITFMVQRGAQYLTGENLEVVWAEFSSLR
jgi:hypothetical protein